MAVADELIKPFFNDPDALLQPVSVRGGATAMPTLRMGQLHGYIRRRGDRATCPCGLRPTSAFLFVALDGIESRVRRDRASAQGDEGERHHKEFRHASHLSHRGSLTGEGQSGEGLFALW